MQTIIIRTILKEESHDLESHDHERNDHESHVLAPTVFAALR